MPEYKVHQLWPKPIFDTEIPVKQQWLDFAYNSEYERVFIDNADYTKEKYVLYCNEKNYKDKLESIAKSEVYNKSREIKS